MLVVHGIIPFPVFVAAFSALGEFLGNMQRINWAYLKLLKLFFHECCKLFFLRCRYEQRPKGFMLKMLRNGSHAGSPSPALPTPALPLVLHFGTLCHNLVYAVCSDEILILSIYGEAGSPSAGARGRSQWQQAGQWAGCMNISHIAYLKITAKEGIWLFSLPLPVQFGSAFNVRVSLYSQELPKPIPSTLIPCLTDKT